MERIEVTTRFTREGSLVPLEFSLGDESHPILNVGRQWETSDGRHILVMDYSERTHHLFFQLTDLCWYLVRDIKSSPERTYEEKS